MTITTDQIKDLRNATGVSIAQCKQALEEANGDMEGAKAVLKEKGALVAQKKKDRDLGAGVVASYIHGGGSIGTLIELLCETDFVAKNEEFQAIARDIAMQVSASDEDALASPDTLLTQPFIKDPSKTVADLVDGAVQKFGERTELGRFVRYEI